MIHHRKKARRRLDRQFLEVRRRLYRWFASGASEDIAFYQPNGILNFKIRKPK
jgi:hypothetical protein